MPNYHPRKLGTITYEAGSRQSLEIDRDGVLMQLNIRLRFTITNTAVAPVGPLFQTLAALIRRVELIVGGRDTVVAIDGPGLAVRAQYEFGTQQHGMGDTVVLTASAVTAYDIVLPVVFYLPRARRPDDTAIDLRRVAQASLAITWGDINDFYATPNSATISLVTCDIEGEYDLDVPVDRLFLVRNLDTVEKDLPGTNNNFDILMDKGTGLFYRSFMVATLADVVAVNTILDPGSLRLEAGSFVFQNRDGVQIRADNKRRFGQESVIAGVYYMTLVPFGEGTRMVNTGLLQSDLKMIFDATKVAGTNLIKVYREAVRPLKL